MVEVSIGMPVLNGAATISRALDDLLHQTFADIEIVVCDNASTDRTAEIVRAHAARDPRVRLLCFDEKVDIIHSFQRAYDHSTAPFFVFAPADDRWYPDFIEKTLAALKKDPGAAACSGRVAFTADGRFSHVSNGTRPLLDTPARNVADYLRDPGENARAFGLFRRAALEGTFPPAEYPGWDFQMIARSLSRGGTHIELPIILAERDTTTYAIYVKQAERLIRNRVLLSVPLHRLALHVLRDRKIRKSWRLLWALGKLMAASHRAYSAQRLPRWSRWLQRLFGPAIPQRAEVRGTPLPVGLQDRRQSSADPAKDGAPTAAP